MTDYKINTKKLNVSAKTIESITEETNVSTHSSIIFAWGNDSEG